MLGSGFSLVTGLAPQFERLISVVDWAPTLVKLDSKGVRKKQKKKDRIIIDNE